MSIAFNYGSNKVYTIKSIKNSMVWDGSVTRSPVLLVNIIVSELSSSCNPIYYTISFIVSTKNTFHFISLPQRDDVSRQQDFLSVSYKKIIK